MGTFSRSPGASPERAAMVVEVVIRVDVDDDQSVGDVAATVRGMLSPPMVVAIKQARVMPGIRRLSRADTSEG